ncbi:MAG: hypothetical protein HY282_10340 [Nitrospirae bacterium]|nr:hypothetical protein [Candidatus Manganitrophaceae bacterium]
MVSLEKQEHRLRENHFGEEWHDGLNVETSLWSRLSFGDHLSLVAEPVFVTPRKGSDLYIRQGYLRLVLSNIALKVGRDSLWWGPGRHGALLLSNNAFPFDLVQVGTASPFSLPGFLSQLGRFEFDGFLTRLEAHRDFPHARLAGLRLVYHPREEIAIGFSRITMFGGDGRPGLTLVDFGRLYLNKPNESGKFEVNELAGIDLRLRPPIDRFLPGHFIELYGEYGGEDESNFIPTKRGILAGLEWRYQARRLILEYASNHDPGFPDVWYHHSTYTSGYTFHGQIIGHHMGSDADDFYFRLASPLIERWSGGVDFERERHHLSNPVPETMFRGGGDLTFFQHADLSYLFRVEYERIENLNLQSENARNMYGIVSAVWTF